jgi:hypothetical protein
MGFGKPVYAPGKAPRRVLGSLEFALKPCHMRVAGPTWEWSWLRVFQREHLFAVSKKEPTKFTRVRKNQVAPAGDLDLTGDE